MKKEQLKDCIKHIPVRSVAEIYLGCQILEQVKSEIIQVVKK